MAEITIERKPKRRAWPLLILLLILALAAAAWWLYGGGQETFAGEGPPAAEEGYAPQLGDPGRTAPVEPATP